MVAGIVGRLLGVGKWVLAAIGLLFLLVEIFGGKAAEKPVAAMAPPASVQAEEIGAACLCSSGAECVGPKGGKYCLLSDGKKRYRSQQ